MGSTRYFIWVECCILKGDLKVTTIKIKNPGPFQKGPGTECVHFDQRLSLSFTPVGGVPEGAP